MFKILSIFALIFLLTPPLPLLAQGKLVRNSAQAGKVIKKTLEQGVKTAEQAASRVAVTTVIPKGTPPVHTPVLPGLPSLPAQIPVSAAQSPTFSINLEKTPRPQVPLASLEHSPNLPPENPVNLLDLVVTEKAPLLQGFKLTNLGDPEEEFSHAVWRVDDIRGKALGIVKIGTREEIKRTRLFHELVSPIIPNFDLIDIEYPLLLAEGYGGLPENLVTKIETLVKSEDFLVATRSSSRLQTPFVLSKIEAAGITYAEVSWGRKAIRHVHTPISFDEWKQVKGFIEQMHAVGFEHTDLSHNLFLSRGKDGRLKVALLDFEKAYFSDENTMMNLEKLLLEQGALLPPTPTVSQKIHSYFKNIWNRTLRKK